MYHHRLPKLSGEIALYLSWLLGLSLVPPVITVFDILQPLGEKSFLQLGLFRFGLIALFQLAARVNRFTLSDPCPSTTLRYWRSRCFGSSWNHPTGQSRNCREKSTGTSLSLPLCTAMISYDSEFTDFECFWRPCR